MRERCSIRRARLRTMSLLSSSRSLLMILTRGCSILDPSVSTYRSDAGIGIEVSMTIDADDPWGAQAAALAAMRDAFDHAVPAVAGITRGLVFQEVRRRCRETATGHRTFDANRLRSVASRRWSGGEPRPSVQPLMYRSPSRSLTAARRSGTARVSMRYTTSRPGILAKIPCGPRTIRPVPTS